MHPQAPKMIKVDTNDCRFVEGKENIIFTPNKSLLDLIELNVVTYSLKYIAITLVKYIF